eukprot:Gb_29893 [translate_table: standard]
MNGNRSNKLRLIQKLGHMVKKSQVVDHDSKGSPTMGCSLSPRFTRRFFYDSDEEYCTNPSDVPEGYLAVYVGKQKKRFIIPTSYLTLPVFRTLLEQAEEEFGFGYKGGLLIPCEVSIFKHVLRLLERYNSVCQNLSLEEMLRFQPKNTECGSEAFNSSKAFSPLFRSSLQKSFG